jgi:hypothetical protein
MKCSANDTLEWFGLFQISIPRPFLLQSMSLLIMAVNFLLCSIIMFPVQKLKGL